ncbi:hypothetical protein Save01_01335 [Streptomyces avermitilis]
MVPDQGHGRGGPVRDDVRDQAPRPVAQHQPYDNRVTDSRMAKEGALDFGRVHSMSADLELGVRPAQVAQLPVVADPYQVACAVGAGRSGDLVQRGEAGGVRWPVSAVADGQVVAQEVEFAVDDRGSGARQRQSDRDVSRSERGVVEVGDGGDHGGLGRPIGVQQPDRRADGRAPAFDPLGEGRLTADDDGAHLGRQSDRTGRNGVRQFVPVGRRQVEEADPQPCAGVQESGDRLGHVVGTDDERGARTQCEEDFLEAGVEVQGGELQDAVPVVKAVAVRGAGDEVREGVVADFDALGAPRGARGVEDVGEVLGRRCRRLGRFGIWSRLVVSQNGPVPEAVGEGAGGEDEVGPGVVQQFRPAGPGRRRVERAVGGTGQQDSEDGGDRVDTARQGDGHQVAVADLTGSQSARECTRRSEESGIRDAGAAVLDGDESAMPGGMVGDQAENRAHGAGQRPTVQDRDGLARTQVAERPVRGRDGLLEQG